MPLAWSKKVQNFSQPPPPPPPSPNEETIQKIDLPIFTNKISLIEHKNGKRLDNTRQKDDETHEIKGDL